MSDNKVWGVNEKVFSFLRVNRNQWQHLRETLSTVHCIITNLKISPSDLDCETKYVQRFICCSVSSTTGTLDQIISFVSELSLGVFVRSYHAQSLSKLSEHV